MSNFIGFGPHEIDCGTQGYGLYLRYTINNIDYSNRSLTINIYGYRMETTSTTTLSPTKMPYTYGYGFNNGGNFDAIDSYKGEKTFSMGINQKVNFGSIISKTYYYKEDGTLDEIPWIDYFFKNPEGLEDLWTPNFEHRSLNITDIPTIEDIRVANVNNLKNNWISAVKTSVHFDVDTEINACRFRLNGQEWVDIETNLRDFEITGLQPNTQYTLQLNVKRADNNKWNTSNIITFTTPKPLKPQKGEVLVEVLNSISARISWTNFHFSEGGNWGYYEFRKVSENWQKIGKDTSYIENDLKPNTDYTWEVRLVDNFDTASDIQQISAKTPKPPAPILESMDVQIISPFEVKVVPGKASFFTNYSYLDYYEYNINNGNYINGGKNIFNIKNLTPETKYKIGLRIVDNYGTYSNTVYNDITTPVDQVKVDIKRAGVYEKGRLWYKINNKYVKAKHVYVRVNGVYVESKREWS